MTASSYDLAAFPAGRRNIVDALEVGVRRHMVHALLEVDVTQAREKLREHRQRTGETLSFTAFVVACLARAIEAHKLLHAYRDWRNRLVLFDDVDVVTLIESEANQVAIPHIIRSANRRTLRGINDEIRTVQSRPASSAQRSGRLARLSAWIPGPVRRLFFRALRRNPRWLKQTSGTTLVTSVGRFAPGAGWGIGIAPLHTLSVVVGGIAQKPGVVEGRIEIREYLHLTLSVDHDIVDGAPAARFTRLLTELLANATGL